MGLRSDSSLKELAWIFLRIGTTAFGGPAAHIAMMEEEFVRRRKWITEENFLDLLGATNLIPGPNSTEMAIHIGFERAGRKGLIIAGICFITPAMLIVLTLAWGYKKYGELPDFQKIFYGIKPVILAIIIQAVWNLTKKTSKNRMFLGLAGVAATSSLFGLSEIPILLLLGLSTLIWGLYRRRANQQTFFSAPLLMGPNLNTVALFSGVALSSVPFNQFKLFIFFLKVGSILYGSGYVLLSFLQTELVDGYGWITQAQLLDAIAVGQFTPGPVFTTATFVGYLISGWSGGLLATLGIFLPSFIFVGFSTRLIPWLRKSQAAGNFLDGVNAASLGLMAAVTVRLGAGALTDLMTVVIAVLCTCILVKWKPNSAWLVFVGGLVGLVLKR